MIHPRPTLIWLYLLLVGGCMCYSACDNIETDPPVIELLGIAANGIPLVDGTINVAPEVTFELTFSSALDPSRFAAAFDLRTSDGDRVNDLTIAYSNANSKANVTTTLLPATSYQLSLKDGTLGPNNDVLIQAINRRFTTRDDGVITELPPCISGTASCLGNLSITNGAGGQGVFTFYRSFPLEMTNARWENLSAAVIVLHGLNRDADEYFNFLMNTLRSEGLEERVLLVAPYFKNSTAAAAGELYWSGSGWREAQNASAPAPISSFTVLDQLLAVLGNPNRFPALETVVIAGHSSGGLYTHAYAAANASENQYPELDFRYVVANSQYFYYPLDVRYDAGSGQFTSVSGCPDYNHWPLGFVNPPPYLSGTNKASVDEQLISRRVTYLLGTEDVVTTGTLNTSDCAAVLLGENRLRRGENMYRLLETNFASTQQSEKVLVSGVGHNAQQMFQSPEFVDWLRQLMP